MGGANGLIFTTGTVAVSTKGHSRNYAPSSGTMGDGAGGGGMIYER